MDYSSINATTIDFGGGWDGNFINYLFTAISTCRENSFNYVKGNPCGSDKERKKLISHGIVSSIMIPFVLFDPSNFENPFIMDMKFIQYGLEDYLIKNLEFKFQNNIIESDNGWIFQQIVNNQMLSYLSYSIDSSFYLTVKDGIYADVISNIYINMDKQVVKYYRKYMKIQELIANVGGILKVISTVSFVIGNFINNIYLNLDLLAFVQSIYQKEFKKGKTEMKSRIEKNNAISVSNDKNNEQSGNIMVINKSPVFYLQKTKLEEKNDLRKESMIDIDSNLKERLSKIEYYCSFSKYIMERIENEKGYKTSSTNQENYSFYDYLKHYMKCNRRDSISYYESKIKHNLDVKEIIKTKMNLEKMIKLIFPQETQENLFN